MSRWALIRPLLYVLIPLVLIVAAMLWLLPDASPPDANTPKVTQQAATKPPVVKQPATTQPASTGKSVKPQQKPPQAAENGLDKTAILSMQQARQQGDPRAPPMSPMPAKRQKPTDEQLSDPKAYAQYEKSQQLKLYQSYVDAVPKKVGRLEKAIKQAEQRDSGITDEQIKAAKDKVKKLKEMREKLLKGNPKLQDNNQKPTAGASSAATKATTQTPSKPSSKQSAKTTQQ